MERSKIFQFINQILWFLFSLYFAQVFIKHGYFKFDIEGFWAPAFSRWGYPVWFMYFIGALEFIGGILILIPKRIGGYGALTLAIVMLGAFVTRSIHGSSADDLYSIAFNCVSMLLLSMERGTYKFLLQRKF